QYIKKTKRYLCHDENELCVVGDEVRILACRPVSKRKTFVVDQIVNPTQRKVDLTGKLHTQWS
ncbi:30S ribosomal protein S17, partial [Sphaeroforma arctica JP610]